MPTARIPAAGVVNGVLYAVGGNLLSTVEAFTPPRQERTAGWRQHLYREPDRNGSVSANQFCGMVLVSLECCGPPK